MTHAFMQVRAAERHRHRDVEAAAAAPVHSTAGTGFADSSATGVSMQPNVMHSQSGKQSANATAPASEVRGVVCQCRSRCRCR